MSDKKHIDRLFQEKLKNFEATPSDNVWANVRDRLHKDKRKRRVIPIWWKLGGVAALLALLLTVGIKFMSNDVDSTTNNQIVDTEKQQFDTQEGTTQQNSNNSEVIDNQSDNSSKIANEESYSDGILNEDSEGKTNVNSEKEKINSNNLNRSNSDKTKVATNSGENSNQKNASETFNRINNPSQKDRSNSTRDAFANLNKSDENRSDQNSVIQNKEQSGVDNLIKDSKNNTDSAVTDASKKMEDILSEEKKETEKTENSIEEAIALANSTEEKDEKEKKLNRWNVSPNVAPVYFNSLGKGSSLDEQFVNNTKDGEVTMSYGVGGSYAINDRLKIRAGINKVDMGYNTNNVIAFRSIDSMSSARSKIVNVSVDDNAESMTYLSAESLNSSITPEIINTKTNGSINQRFGFIEVPLEMEYALINKKLGVNVIGGFSTLIVDKNEIYSTVNGNQTRIGEANNINNLSYSANFGLGINYNISEKIKVNVEPTFKYQINTFNNSSGDFQPYFIGVYTGLSYKF